jgi:hypothetical protein
LVVFPNAIVISVIILKEEGTARYFLVLDLSECDKMVFLSEIDKTTTIRTTPISIVLSLIDCILEVNCLNVCTVAALMGNFVIADHYYLTVKIYSSHQYNTKQGGFYPPRLLVAYRIILHLDVVYNLICSLYLLRNVGINREV